ncbi:CAP domain-containing protein [Patulibacter defluvii]|uniref:CAP domain-containing protein n=1 Tax=Patulibacter defluvii TaxID=3095358 RepID=UPI002A75C2C5|nr:CAP domain-containing protein [Patulibacter sp. DM4]
MGRRLPFSTALGLTGAAVAAGLAGAPGAGAATACPGADGRPASIGTAKAAAAVRCLVRHERAAVGLPALTAEARLALAAQRHADDMVGRGYFDHTAPAPAPFGATAADRVSATGYSWSAVGENIAAGQATPRAVLAGWLSSAGHCANLVGSEATEIGVGIATGGVGAVPGPTWVLVVARPLHVARPGGQAAGCPRSPASPAATDPDRSGSGSPSGTPADPVGRASGLRLHARRHGRSLRLRVRIAWPGASGKVRIRVHVVQGERSRDVVVRRRANRDQRFSVRLRRAGRGRVTVRVPGQRLALRFR